MIKRTANWLVKRQIDWCIMGGESGHERRALSIDAAEYMQRQCARLNIPLLVKQDSGPRPGLQGRLSDELWNTKQWPPEAYEIPEVANA